MIIINSFLLFILALFLLCLLSPFGISWAIITTIRWNKKEHLKRYIANIFFALSFLIDILGNIVLSPFMNRWFILKESIYKFGSVKHTISLVLGYNYRNHTLTKYGLKLYYLLEIIEKNHCEKAIEDFENIKFKNNPWII